MAAEILVIENFIDGKFTACDKHIDSYDPSTGMVYCKVPDSGKAEVDQAVRAAKRAFESWSKTTPQYRGDIMRRVADLLEARLEEFAVAESRDQGKPISLARRVDIPRACLNLRFFASAITHKMNRSDVIQALGNVHVNYTTSTPVGVAGLISPWNLPVYLLTFKIAPAIAAGCTVVCKPSEFTSVTAWMLASLMVEAGLPAGVCNMVFGSGPNAGQHIVEHPDVPLISFTGSTMTGQKITQSSAPFTKKLSLELGGKNPCVVFEDADLKNCIRTTVRSSFANQGEICLCSSRIYVQRGIYDKFLQSFVEETRKFKVGDPRAADTSVGALVSKEHLAKVQGYVQLAVEEGGTIHCGYGKDGPLELPLELREGYFMRPTVISGLPDEARCMQEEIFGPVTCIVPFDTEDEVIKRANDVKYGLCAVLWSENSSRVHRVAQQLDAGTVWVNCWLVRDLNMPFGGMKMSGMGREGAQESLDFYTEQKTICIKV